jgi:hypothetical protein
MHAVPARFALAGGLHSIVRTHSRPRSTVPRGQTQRPATGPGTFGGVQAGGGGGSFTHSPPRCAVPCGQTQLPAIGPVTFGGAQVGGGGGSFTHSPPRSAVPCGQTQLPATGPGIFGGAHTGGGGGGVTQAAPRRVVPGGQSCGGCVSATVAHELAVTLKGGVVVALVTVTVMQFCSGPFCPGGIMTVTGPENVVSPTWLHENETRVGAGVQMAGATVPGQDTLEPLSVRLSATVTVDPGGMLLMPTLMLNVQGLVAPPGADDVQLPSSAPGFARTLLTVRKQDTG